MSSSVLRRLWADNFVEPSRRHHHSVYKDNVLIARVSSRSDAEAIVRARVKDAKSDATFVRSQDRLHQDNIYGYYSTVFSRRSWLPIVSYHIEGRY